MSNPTQQAPIDIYPPTILEVKKRKQETIKNLKTTPLQLDLIL